MNHYFLRLGERNNEVESRLGKRRPEAVLYFDDKSERAYKEGAGNAQVQLFWNAGKGGNRDRTIMVVIHQAKVWILRPSGRVSFGKRSKEPDGTWLAPKVMPVRILTEVASKMVPPVLASMACSPKHRRAFTTIDHWGNLKAIDWTLQQFDAEGGRRWMPLGSEPDSEVEEHWKKFEEYGKANQGPKQLFECLGSTELETLVAKLLESHGCHVPAHRGGALGDIDLFAWNDSGISIDLDDLKIPRRGKCSIQVKTWAEGGRRPTTVDYLIGFGVKGKQAFDENWLLQQMKRRPTVFQWMHRSLYWLPEWYFRLDQFGLADLLDQGHGGPPSKA